MRGVAILLNVGLLILHAQGHWIPGKEYHYEIYTETITSHDSSKIGLHKNVGLVTIGNLILQSQNGSYLRAQIQNPRYREVYDVTPDEKIESGFNTIQMSRKSFGISLRDGIVKSLDIDENVATWELNYYKSILGLLQINMTQKSATTFQSIEDSITGRCEVVYEIAPINDKDVLVTKTKDFSNCDHVTEYHSQSNNNPLNYDSSKNENILTRFATSKTTVADYWENPMIKTSDVFSQITVKLSSNLPDIATITSKLKLKLLELTEVERVLPAVSNPQSIESLLYVQNNPFENSHSRGQNSLRSNFNQKLDEAPSFLLLPYFIGNEGNVVWKDKSGGLVGMLRALTSEINKDLLKNNLISNDAIEKMSMLTELIRTLNIKQIDDIVKSFDTKSSTLDSSDVKVFYKAVGLAGTGPALLSLKKWIGENKIEEVEASHAVEALSKNVVVPSIDYLNEFFTLLNMDNVQKSAELYKSTVLSFSNLIRYYVVKDSEPQKNPVDDVRSESHEAILATTEKYLQYFAEQLKRSIEEKDSGKISLFTLAIGKTNHRKILSIFKQYIEGTVPLSTHQRTWMVVSLSGFAKTWPEIARSVLYRIYMNTMEDYEVRCAAVYLIMQTNPPVGVLQKMADNTKYDRSKHVNSVVRDAIIAAAQLEGNDELSRSAKSTIPLLNPRIERMAAPRYLKANLDSKNLDVILDLMNLHNRGSYNIGILGDLTSSFSDPSMKFRLIISEIQNILNEVTSKNQSEHKSFKFSSENIAKMLGIKPEHAKISEGLLFMENKMTTLFVTLDDVLNLLKESSTQTESPQGLLHEKTKHYSHGNHDITITFPTETGFIFYYTLQTPMVSKYETSYTFDTEKTELKLRTDCLNTQSSLGRVGFVAPFRNALYLVGFDDHMQVNIPVHLSYVYNENKQYVSLIAEPLSPLKSYHLLQRKAIPFVTKINFLEMKPATRSSRMNIIKSTNIISQRFTDIPGITWESHASVYDTESESMLNIFLDNNRVRWSSFNLKWDTDVGNTQKANITIFFDLQNTTTSNFTDQRNTVLNVDAGKIDSEWESDHDKRKQSLDKVLQGVNAGRAIALDVFIDLKWYESIGIMAKTAFSYSQIDQQIKHLGHYKIKYSDQSLDLCTDVVGRSSIETIFDSQRTLKSVPFVEALGDFHFGLEDCHNAKLKVHLTAHQSENRKNEILQNPEVKNCLTSTENILVNCAKALKLNHLADEQEASLIFDESTDIFKTAITKGLIQLSMYMKDEIQASRPKRNWDKNKITFRAVTIPRERVDITISTPEMDFKFKNSTTFILRGQRLGDRTLRMLSRNLEYINLNVMDRSQCILDDTQLKTFDQKVYNLTLSKCWQAILTSVPYYVNDELKVNEESRISILMKDPIVGDRRDLMIVLGNHKILFYTRGDSLKVEIDDKAFMNSSVYYSQYDNQRNISLFYVHKSSEQIYSVKSSFHGIYINFDGKHLIIEIDDELKTHLRGLCGNADGDEENELETPGQCQENEKLFAYSWVLEKDFCDDQGFKQNFNSNLNRICERNEPIHLSIIDDKEAGLAD